MLCGIYIYFSAVLWGLREAGGGPGGKAPCKFAIGDSDFFERCVIKD